MLYWLSVCLSVCLSVYPSMQWILSTLMFVSLATWFWTCGTVEGECVSAYEQVYSRVTYVDQCMQQWMYTAYRLMYCVVRMCICNIDTNVVRMSGWMCMYIHNSLTLYSTMFALILFVWLQWNLSIEDTTGTQLAVLYREASLIQR